MKRMPFPARINLLRQTHGADKCWPWPGSLRFGGYGQVKLPGKPPTAAHREAYQLLVGPIAADLVLDHTCRNRRCVNPVHLEPVSRAENILRGYSALAENARKTHCVRGHPFSNENTKLTPAGHRLCKTCISERSRGLYSHEPKQPHNRDKTHCARGHEFTPENTRISRAGRRECRACANERSRREIHY